MGHVHSKGRVQGSFKANASIQLKPNIRDQSHWCIAPQVSGILAPKPVSSFGHLGFDEQMMKTIRKAKYTTPMPIQAQVRETKSVHTGCFLRCVPVQVKRR